MAFLGPKYVYFNFMQRLGRQRQRRREGGREGGKEGRREGRMEGKRIEILEYLKL